MIVMERSSTNLTAVGVVPPGRVNWTLGIEDNVKLVPTLSPGADLETCRKTG